MEFIHQMDGLPSECVLEILKCLLPRELLDFGSTCKLVFALCDEHENLLWERLCTLRWEAWPTIDFDCIANLTSTESRKLVYKRAEKHASNKNLDSYDLISNAWLFNFTPAAGGRGKNTLMKAYFAYTETNKLVLSIPPHYTNLGVHKLLPRRDVSEGGCDELFCTCETPCQQVAIHSFPLHRIQKIEHTRQWLITNDYVTILSVGKDYDPCGFDDRGFITLKGTNTRPTGSLQNM